MYFRNYVWRRRGKVFCVEIEIQTPLLGGKPAHVPEGVGLVRNK